LGAERPQHSSANAPAPAFLPPPLSIWEGWYAAASPAQRDQFLDQARQQGLLFAHQLPAPERTPSASPARLALARLLGAGPANELPAAAEAAFEAFDRDLDDAQRQAVARALGTPDLCLVLGYPGSGKSRVAAELTRQAVRRGWRVLLVSHDPPAIDRVVEALSTQGLADKLLRWLGEQESLAGLPPASAALSLAGRLHYYQQRTVPAARKAVADLRSESDRCRQQAERWGRLEALLGERARLEQAEAELLAERANLPSAVAAEAGEAAGPGAAELNAVRRRLADLRAEGERLQAEHRQLDEERQKLLPLVEAKESHRWWTGAFWKATLGSGSSRTRLEEMAGRCQQIEERQHALAAEQANLEAQAAELQRRQRQECERRCEEEVARRQAALDARLSEVAGARRQAAAVWEREFAQLERPPTEATCASLAQGRGEEAQRLARLEEEARCRQDWLTALENAPCDKLGAELLARASVLASTVDGLPPDPASSLGAFDLVLLDEAHHATEADLDALAGFGARLVLLGDVEPELPIAPPANPRPRRDRAPADGAAAPRVVPPPPPFLRLWSTLHPDPRRLGGRCRLVNGRLVVTLRHLPAEQQGWVQREPVFDRPEVELGILSAPGQEPSVVEVVFPGSTSVADAKTFLHRELQELAVHASAPQPRWREGETAWVLDLSPASEGEKAVVSLDDGVREHVGRCACHADAGEVSWQTQYLEFDKAAGWDLARAAGWVHERLRLRDTGRTTLLARGHRFRPGLARHLSALLYSGNLFAPREAATSATGPAGGTSVVFLPVPAGQRGDNGDAPAPAVHATKRGSDPGLRWNGSGHATATLTSPARAAQRTARGGAGLEVDLIDPRRIDALPNDLRPLLPPRGVVNYLEARAVVHELEALAQDEGFRAARAAWCAERGPAVAVMSLFPAQAKLLRVLIDRSAVLASAGLRAEVGQPWEFRQREALAVLLSLTRSHATRAVPFSDHPRALVLALTRAAERLLIFGDPGTMSRRSQWFGALDHLDETTGPLEQALLGQLLAGLPEHEAAAPQPRAYAGK
jgi:hypothetical protein